MTSWLLALAIVSATSETARATSCAETLAARFAKFTQTRMKLMARCHDLVLSGHTSGACPDSRTAAALDKARTKLHQLIDKRCGGDDETCGTGADDVDLASVGWGVSRCPNVRHGACNGPIHHCGDVADCLACIGETSTDEAVALPYDDLEPHPLTSEVARCQATIGRSVARYFDAMTSAFASCEQRDLDDEVAGTCPDSQKAVPRLVRAGEKLVNRICGACGSGNDLCGGDDIPPDWIGFPSSCPDVTPPGGTTCSHPIDNLVDLIGCVQCVTDYHVRCLDPLAVPSLQSYPAQCR
jgi:hypothetical protein